MNTILITRPREDTSRTAELVAARGFVPLVAPFLTIRHLAPKLPAGPQAVLVTSGNALPGLGVLDVPMLTVGDATARRARQVGFSDVRSAGRDATALVALTRQVMLPNQGALLLACGARQGVAMAATLRANGYSVIRRVTYEAKPVRIFPTNAAAALRNGEVCAALFLSAETALAFVRALPPALAPHLTNVMALAIGNPAADALQTLPWRSVRVAAAPTLDDVLALL